MSEYRTNARPVCAECNGTGTTLYFDGFGESEVRTCSHCASPPPDDRDEWKRRAEELRGERDRVTADWLKATDELRMVRNIASSFEEAAGALVAARDELHAERRLVAAFVDAVQRYIIQHGVEHEEGCPEDSACACTLIASINATHSALKLEQRPTR